MSSSKLRKQYLVSPSCPTRINHAQLIGSSLITLASIVGIFFLAIVMGQKIKPGDPLIQSSATIGVILLTAPVFFSIIKRSGIMRNPPRWFAIHVFASMAGSIFLSIHVSAGNILSIPGFLFFLLVTIMAQGIYSRVYISKSFSNQFGSRESSFYISKADKNKLNDLIIHKTKILGALDKYANEAVFSPNLYHALRHPFLTYKYVVLTSRESRLVGARKRAGVILSLWRPLHILMAITFILGITAHIVTVIFFAGYVAGDDIIYWWHIAAWGN